MNIVTLENIEEKIADFRYKNSYVISSLMKSLGIKSRKTFIQYLNREDEIGEKLREVYLDIVEFWEKSLMDSKIHGHNVMFYLKSAIRSLGFNYARENDGSWTDESRLEETAPKDNNKIVFEIVTRNENK
jgi:hypothetical protein